MSFCYRWVFSSNSIEDLVKKHLNPLLLGMRPKFIGKPLIICNLVVCNVYFLILPFFVRYLAIKFCDIMVCCNI